jgi:hypothetical protein
MKEPFRVVCVKEEGLVATGRKGAIFAVSTSSKVWASEMVDGGRGRIKCSITFDASLTK